MLKDFIPASSSQITKVRWKVLAGLVILAALLIATRVFPVHDWLRQALDVYLGSLARRPGGTRAEWVLYGVGLLAIVAVTVLLTRLARRALAKKIAADG